MTPPEHLRELLAESRREGEEFADVWSVNVALATQRCGRSERRWWCAVLIEQRAAWENAYYRRGRAALDLALLDDSFTKPAKAIS